jgi:hypothetical protein
VTYLLAGEVKTGGLCVTVIREEDIEDKCGQFKNITSKHVYSIAKYKHNDETLSAVDVFDNKDKTRYVFHLKTASECFSPSNFCPNSCISDWGLLPTPAVTLDQILSLYWLKYLKLRLMIRKM